MELQACGTKKSRGEERKGAREGGKDWEAQSSDKNREQKLPCGAGSQTWDAILAQRQGRHLHRNAHVFANLLVDLQHPRSQHIMRNLNEEEVGDGEAQKGKGTW
jgi:hypothetical protein